MSEEKKKMPSLKDYRRSQVQMSGIFEEIQSERLNQDLKWGVQDHHPEKWLLILMEEVGEASEAVIEAYPFVAKITDEDHAGFLIKYRYEMIQAAAVSVAAIEALDRAMAGATLPGR